MIQFTCQSCGVGLRVPDTKAGQSGECPQCGEPMHVPAPAAASPPDLPRAAPGRPGRNAFAIAGLVCASASALLGILMVLLLLLAAAGGAGTGPVAGGAAVLLVLLGLSAILGLVFSILGLRRSRSAGAGRGVAITGLTLSAVMIVLCGTLVAVSIYQQREMSRWSEELWERAKDGSGTDPGDL